MTRLRPATIAVHAGLHPDPQTGAVGGPLVLSSTFAHGNPGAWEYAREGNPTWAPLEEALTVLEQGSHAVVFSSGMAAIAAVVETVPVGAAVVVPHSCYSGTRLLLGDLNARGRLQTRVVDIADTEAVLRAVPGAALLMLETITNPLLTVPELDACIDAAKAAGARTLVDNTFATPCLVRPLSFGADVVVHSLTKYVGGHSDLILGAAITADSAFGERLRDWRTTAGAIAGPLETWLALRGLRTLDVRLHRQVSNAADLAQRLAGHAQVTRVHYPGLADHPHHHRAARLLGGGFGAVVSIEVAGGADRAEAVCDATRVWTHATSLGGVESTLERRARYPLDAAIVPPSLIRLSVGIEDVDDLYDDLDMALQSTRD